MTDATDNTASAEELEAARGYERLFVPALFGAWAPAVAAAARLRPGDRVLDIACGSGVLARAALAAVGESGRVTGLDPAPGMIAAAREIEPGIDWMSGRAERLGFDDGTFDAVVSQFGLMFFPDRQAAVAGMHRVLVPEGRLALAVWDSLDRNPAYREVIAILDDLVGTNAGDALRLPYCLGDAAGVVELLEGGGFTAVVARTRSGQGTFASARTMVEAELRGWLPLFGITLDEARIAAVLDRADSRLADWVQASGKVVFPTSAHIVTAKRR